MKPKNLHFVVEETEKYFVSCIIIVSCIKEKLSNNFDKGVAEACWC